MEVCEDQPMEECATFAIGVCEGDKESLHFPDGEDPLVEVDEVQLRLGRQLPNSSPQQKNPSNKHVTPSDATDHPKNVSVKYDVIAHLKKISTMLFVYDALCLSSDLRKAFITELSFPEDYRVEVSQVEANLAETQNMTSTNENLLLGAKKHNRPLLMLGEIDDLSTNHIMVDNGSAINLLPLCTLKRIGYSQKDLSQSNVIIHGLNQSRQEAMGTISSVLKLEKLITYVTFHVIDIATSYNALVGRPWLHANGIVPSTLHQCIKYKDPLGDVVRIFTDKKPFTVEESFYVDAKFYFDLIDKISKPKVVPPPNPEFPRKYGKVSSSKRIYQYIPSNQRKKDDPIFRIVDETPRQDKGIKFPTPLPHLVQHKIKQPQLDRLNKSKAVIPITLFNKDDKALPISLYDDKVFT
jgi:hypothetical protein